MFINNFLQSQKFLYFLLALVYGFGLFLPLMENDSAQHATMAMDMYLRNDFTHLFKAFEPYLDKPHLHFWLSAFSFKIFGVHDWAYRIPALLFTILGAISCFHITKIVYSKKAAMYAPLIFLSSQAIILANHDVRTDAVLTGATAFSIWQLIAYFNGNSIKNLALGAIGLGLSFMSKGLLGVFVICMIMGVHLLYERKLKALLSYKIILGLLLLALTISPALYAYYVQFGMEGVRFILWDQSFNRMTAKGFTNNNPDYFFFFHTLLWAFLPWGILMYIALVYQIKSGFKDWFQKKNKKEFFSSIGVLLVLLVISSSKTKLPHYINSLFPLLSVLIAGYLSRKNIRKKTIKAIGITQISILSLAFLLVLALISFAFQPEPLLLFIFISVAITSLYVILKIKKGVQRILFGSVLFSIVVNIYLNSTFYAQLLPYQSTYKAAAFINATAIDKSKVYKIDNIHTWPLDFYTEQLTPTIPLHASAEEFKDKWLYVTEGQYRALLEKGVLIKVVKKIPNYRVTRLSAKFLNPATREKSLSTRYLIST